MIVRFVVPLALAVGLGWFAGPLLGAEPGTQPPVEDFEPASEAQPAEARTTVDSQLAAAALESDGRCHPEVRRAALVALRWQPAQAEELAGQRVEISKFRDGFSKGRFEVTRELPLSLEALSVEAPEPGVNYYWRVVTRGAGGWVASAVERFEVPVCPWDGDLVNDGGER